MKKTVSILLAVLLLCTMALPSFAAEVSVQAEIENLVSWLQKPENSKVDFEDTSKISATADWITIVHARSGREVPKGYTAYLEAALPQANLYPADAARIYIAASSAGMDVKNIGGVDLVKVLSEVSYKEQTYMSSLIYPLLAMDYNKDIAFPEEVRQEIIKTILAAQKPADEEFGGAFNWDTDPSRGVDTDTTAMALQALAPYKDENPEVKTAIDNALSYLKTVKAGNGGYGHPQWGVSAECTAQVVIALCSLGIDPTSEEYSNNGKTPIDALKSYVLAEGGAGSNGRANLMTTYQTALGLIAFDRFQKGETPLFVKELPKPEVPETTTEEPTSEVTNEAPKEEPTTSQDTVDIPKTGFEKSAAPMLLTAALMGAAVLTLKKKHD